MSDPAPLHRLTKVQHLVAIIVGISALFLTWSARRAEPVPKPGPAEGLPGTVWNGQTKERNPSRGDEVLRAIEISFKETTASVGYLGIVRNCDWWAAGNMVTVNCPSTHPTESTDTLRLRLDGATLKGSLDSVLPQSPPSLSKVARLTQSNV